MLVVREAIPSSRRAPWYNASLDEAQAERRAAGPRCREPPRPAIMTRGPHATIPRDSWTLAAQFGVRGLGGRHPGDRGARRAVRLSSRPGVRPADRAGDG